MQSNPKMVRQFNANNRGVRVKQEQEKRKEKSLKKTDIKTNIPGVNRLWFQIE